MDSVTALAIYKVFLQSFPALCDPDEDMGGADTIEELARLFNEARETLQKEIPALDQTVENYLAQKE